MAAASSEESSPAMTRAGLSPRALRRERRPRARADLAQDGLDGGSIDGDSFRGPDFKRGRTHLASDGKSAAPMLRATGPQR